MSPGRGGPSWSSARAGSTAWSPSAGHPVLQAADPAGVWEHYDAERVKEAFRQGAGLLRGVDREELLRDLHGQREQDSAGRPAD